MIAYANCLLVIGNCFPTFPFSLILLLSFPFRSVHIPNFVTYSHSLPYHSHGGFSHSLQLHSYFHHEWLHMCPILVGLPWYSHFSFPSTADSVMRSVTSQCHVILLCVVVVVVVVTPKTAKRSVLSGSHHSCLTSNVAAATATTTNNTTTTTTTTTMTTTQNSTKCFECSTRMMTDESLPMNCPTYFSVLANTFQRYLWCVFLMLSV